MKSIILATLCLTVLSAPLSADNEEKDIPTWPHAITNTSDVRNRYHFNLLSPEGLKHIIALAKEVSFKDDRMRPVRSCLDGTSCHGSPVCPLDGNWQTSTTNGWKSSAA